MMAIKEEDGMLNIINPVLQDDPLVQLVQKDNFVGWIYRIDYDTAHLMTNDLWKANALGVPHNSFLLAAPFDPDNFASVPHPEREVILLRVVGSSRLPQDDDLVRAKVDHYQDQYNVYARDYDDITLNQMQFGGLECRVLGTFYMRGGPAHLPASRPLLRGRRYALGAPAPARRPASRPPASTPAARPRPYCASTA